MALASVSTIFLSLDSTAVLVNPVVVLLAIRAKIPPLPFALTTVWLANTGSLAVAGIEPDQPAGPASAEHYAAGLCRAGVGAVAGGHLVAGVPQGPARYFKPQPRGSVTDRPLLITAALTVLLLLPALVSGIPVAIPSAIAALFLLSVFLVRRWQVLRWGMLPWRPLLLTVGLFPVVQTLHAHGLAALLGRVSGHGNGYASLLQLSGLGALSSNGVNNLPAYLALEPVADSPIRLAALLIGVNLGQLVSPCASLAGLLWHERLKALGVNISWRDFALAGLTAVVVMLPLAVLALWLAAGLPA